ncbi:leucine-rich repeat-containing protein 66 [Eulemur rufifrons]|uniref:leucine-rich repeat-containing protein 66 n=1 Tax=Eulemur rufifrons TaxID=859984 RepID=UPI0037428D82
MKILCFRVITIVIGLYFTGTMTNPSRKSSILFNSECQWSAYLLTNCSFTGKHDIPVDTSQIAATVSVSLSFFRVLLQPHTKEEWKIKHLDLSNNLISKITLSPLAYVRTLEVLNLSDNAIHSISLDLPGPKSSRAKRHKSSFTNGLPCLKVLILQRNKLTDAPKGLWKLKSLQSLDLSFNEILQIGWSDFHKCLQLEKLYLKSNKIFKIHPEAFKDLKKLQIVDLSNNALTTILPMMIIALELPHLEVDLAGNQWQCDNSMAVFQNVISESWRKNWNVICNKSIGNDEGDRGAPHLPPARLGRGGGPASSGAARPGPGGHPRTQTPGQPGPRPGRLRRARDVRAEDRDEDAARSLTLAICLSVVITFPVAFCLGAFSRPYLDRLWSQSRCRRRPGSDRAYSNAGFYEDIGAAGGAQRLKTPPRQAASAPNPYENPDRFWVAAPRPQAAAVPGRTPGGSGAEPGSWGQGGGDTRGGRAGDNALPGARSLARPYPHAGDGGPASAAQGHIYRNDFLGELYYDTVAQEQPLGEPPVGVSSVAGTSQNVSGSSPRDANWDPSLSRAVAASGWEMRTHLKAQRTGESEERGDAEQSPRESVGWAMGFPKETPASAPHDLQGAAQQRLEGADAEEELPASCRAVTRSDPGHRDPPAFPPTWVSGLDVTPANQEPVQKSAPSDTQPELESDDEGSLFTLSSASSEGARNGTEDQALGEDSCEAREPLQDQSSGASRDNVMSLASLGDNVTFQNILGRCENQEDQFEKALVSGPDSGLCKTHLENASNINKFEDPSPSPRSPENSPIRDEIPGMYVYDYDIVPQSWETKWLYSLKDLEFSNVDIVPQTPLRSAEVPSDPDKGARYERDSDICTQKPFMQGVDTAHRDIPFEVTTGETIRPSQQDPEGDDTNSNGLETDADDGFVRPPEDCDPRRVVSQTQLLQSYGDDPALQSERGGGGYFEDGSRNHAPLLQELPNETSSLRAQEHFRDGDWVVKNQHCDANVKPALQPHGLGRIPALLLSTSVTSVNLLNPAVPRTGGNSSYFPHLKKITTHAGLLSWAAEALLIRGNRTPVRPGSHSVASPIYLVCQAPVRICRLQHLPWSHGSGRRATLKEKERIAFQSQSFERWRSSDLALQEVSLHCPVATHFVVILWLKSAVTYPGFVQWLPLYWEKTCHSSPPASSLITSPTARGGRFQPLHSVISHPSLANSELVAQASWTERGSSLFHGRNSLHGVLRDWFWTLLGEAMAKGQAGCDRRRLLHSVLPGHDANHPHPAPVFLVNLLADTQALEHQLVKQDPQSLHMAPEDSPTPIPDLSLRYTENLKISLEVGETGFEGYPNLPVAGTAATHMCPPHQPRQLLLAINAFCASQILIYANWHYFQTMRFPQGFQNGSTQSGTERASGPTLAGRTQKGKKKKRNQ